MINLINIANFHYQMLGYQYVDVPWMIDQEAYDITSPKDAEKFIVKGKYLVASAEQSFLDMMIKGQLTPGEYLTTTPCFRDEVEDELHKTYFLKTELINTEKVDEFNLERMINHALGFFGRFTDVESIPMVDHKGEKSFDIIDQKTGIELGSYGIRKYKDIEWIYGTGIAEPRLSTVLKKTHKFGYHNTIIPKGDIGDFTKIEEEFEELKDAIQNQNSLMALTELSDMIGAIEKYVFYRYEGTITLNDLLKLKDSTEKAFKNGRRINNK